MTKRIKVIVAGALLAVTAFAIGLLAVSFTGTASASPTNLVALAAQADPASFMAASTTTTTTTDPKQPGPKGPGFGPGMRGGGMSTGAEIMGPITKIDNGGSTITVGKRTVTLNDQTVVGDASGTLAKSDLKVDDMVVALGKAETDGSLTARWVLKEAALPAKPVSPVKGDFIGGGVKSINAANNSFVITATVTKGQAATDVTIVVSSTTQYKGVNLKSLSDLKVGDKVMVVGTKQADGSYSATVVGVLPDKGMPGGPHGPRMPGGPGKPGGSIDPNFPNPDNQGASFDPDFSLPQGDDIDTNFYTQG